MSLSVGNFLFQQKQAHSWRKLAQKYPEFTYLSYAYRLQANGFVILFQFHIGNSINFSPQLVIHGVTKEILDRIPKDVLNNLVFHLGLIEGLSYWKSTAAKTIRVDCGVLDSDQIDWWKHLLLHGMGEYAFTNSIDLSYLEDIAITTRNDVVQKSTVFTSAFTDRALIPVGGGKDSAVTLEILKPLQQNASVFFLNPIPAALQVAQAGGYKTAITVERTIDPALLALNKKGFLNGHTPFSAYLAFLSVLCAVLFDYKDIVLSNERSANVGNVFYQEREINHQYSKSFDFEKRFHDYAQTYLAPNVNYFSFLRPLYDLQIAKIFSNFSQYHNVFRSCNVGQKTNTWCGSCAKCLFVFVTLYPFLGRERTVGIFGSDLFTKSNLMPIASDLLGETKQKPFDCVGTYEEVRAAFYLSLKEERADQVMLKYFKDTIIPKYTSLPNDTAALLQSFNEERLLPENYRFLLKKYL